MAEHLFNNICNAKLSAAGKLSESPNKHKKDAVYTLNREGKMRMNFKHKYKGEVGAVEEESEYIQAWDRTVEIIDCKKEQPFKNKQYLRIQIFLLTILKLQDLAPNQ